MRYTVTITSNGKTLTYDGYTYLVIGSIFATIERLLIKGNIAHNVVNLIPDGGDSYRVTYNEVTVSND